MAPPRYTAGNDISEELGVTFSSIDDAADDILECKRISGQRMRVAKWGNSLAIRLPSTVVEALGLQEGDDVQVHVLESRDFAISRKPGREDLLKRLRDFRGRLPVDFKFDREDANAR